MCNNVLPESTHALFMIIWRLRGPEEDTGATRTRFTFHCEFLCGCY